MSESISFTFEGRELTGRRGESLAAALIAAGVRSFRVTRTGAERSIFCGMGVCQDCLVEVDGETNRRACMVKLDRPMIVRRESFARELLGPLYGAPPRTVEEIPEETPEILVVGAGPGGLSAAIAARRAGAKVVVLDERPLPGGQYFKQVAIDAGGAPPDAQHLEGRRLIEAARAASVEIRNGVDIWGAFPPATLAATQDGAARTFTPARLIVAAGAYERGVPFPGWTLPGVMTTGAAQTLWRSYRRLAGRRILIAGNGPLNFQVAAELAAGGAEIAAVIELAEMPMARSALTLAAMAMASPRLVREGLAYRRLLHAARVPVLYGSAVLRVERGATGLTVQVAPLRAKYSVRTFSVDTVCLGYGFHPSNEILRALGCEHGYDAARDQLVTHLAPDGTGKTSIPSVFALGDCTGLGGARMALAQGTLAGLAAASEVGHAIGGDLAAERDRARRDLVRHRGFQSALWRLFAAPRLNLDLATSETVVCRCEEISAGEIDATIGDGCPSIGELKRTTRAGMGACQGRYCGPLLSRLMADRLGRAPEEDLRFAPRVPLKPVPVTDIARPSR
ncbi:MAG TPA: FAD-dependent oxidoreductase [Stellaceae bacterium]|nr:FAD-dependent oxidoreductase [Stellaceae bacterium]